MRNNTLHIEYSGSIRNIHCNDGLKESTRCNSLDKAKDRVKRISATGIIRSAVYTDSNGVETKLK